MFRILNQFPAYLDNDGQPVALGYLRFYESGTLTPKSVYSEPSLSDDAGDRVDLDSAGRTVSDVWGDGAYRVRLYGADEVMIAEADDVEIAGGAAVAIPPLVPDQFLTNDGSVMSWAPIREVPDPTGQNGKTLGTDGTNLTWVPAPETPDLPVPDGGITQPTATLITIGDILIQFGSDSAAASGAGPTTKAVSFPTPFQSAPKVFVQPTVFATSPGGFLAATGTNVTAGGFTAKFDNNSGYDKSNENITNAVTFDWIAIGTKVPTP